MSNGNIKKFQKSKGYESLSRSMLQDTENLSLQAIGLLAYLTSLPDDWQVHKTELYKRFKKNGRRSVASAWENLIESGYILQFKKREGKRIAYSYYHYHEPFSKEDIELIERQEELKIWDGHSDTYSISLNNSSTVHFEQYKMNCTKRTDSKLTNKQITHKDLDTLDTENPSYPQYPQNTNRNVKTKEDYMNDAFYKNRERVPEEISNMFKAFFGNDTQRSEKSYQTILRAKKKVEDEIGAVIWLEHDLGTIQIVIQAFSLAIRKVEKTSNVSNPDGYVYTSVYNALSYHYQSYGHSPNPETTLFNWLEDES